MVNNDLLQFLKHLNVEENRNKNALEKYLSAVG